MPVDPITSRHLLIPGGGPGAGTTGSPGAALDSFGTLLSSALENLNRLDNTANQAVARLAAGEDVDLHQVMIAVQEADIAFQLALQVRNKLVDAYHEVMRMQV
jgi:flagellar hook-basal body complex protein FliE